MTDRKLFWVLLSTVLVIPLVAIVLLPVVPSWRTKPSRPSWGKSYPPSPLQFTREEPAEAVAGLPLITHVSPVDLEADGRPELLVCDATGQRVSYIAWDESNRRTETTLAEDVSVPAHAVLADLNQNGEAELIVAVLGSIFPDDGVIGRVEAFELRPNAPPLRHVLLDDVRRVADVQPADLDGDGDVDLAVAVFGYSRGQVLWLENRGSFQFAQHELLNAPGTIHVPIADYDGDGDLDVAAIVTQDEEELWAFENLGAGRFSPRQLWRTSNFDLGGAGLVKTDLDQDGDVDLLLPAGDNLEDLDAYPQPHHGCYWFENQGNWSFQQRRIADLGGTYAADVGDLDGDGDLDVVLVSMTNDWYDPRNASLVWLENDGRQNFQTWQIANDPIHLVTVAVTDLDGDGRADIASGGLNFRKPYGRTSRVTTWWNPGREAP